MRFLKRTGRYLARSLALMTLVIAGYLLAALACACIPVNRGFHSQAGGVPIWVWCSEIHTDIVMPAQNAVFDWSDLLDHPPGDRLVAIGWGDRRVYLETPTWSDLELSTVAGAVLGLHPTVLHVVWLNRGLEAGPRCRALRLSAEQYGQLCAFIRASFSATVVPIPQSGYWSNDAFYEAVGSYSAIHTCNTWAGEALAAAGVRVGVWTPLPWGVLWQVQSP